MIALLINDFELEEEIAESLSKLRMQRNSVVYPENQEDIDYLNIPLLINFTCNLHLIN